MQFFINPTNLISQTTKLINLLFLGQRFVVLVEDEHHESLIIPTFWAGKGVSISLNYLDYSALLSSPNQENF
jgi:hypothetical protein